MRKIYQLIVLLALLFCALPGRAETKTTTWTFPTVSETVYLTSSNYADYVPGGWKWDMPVETSSSSINGNTWYVTKRATFRGVYYGIGVPQASAMADAGHMVFYLHKGSLQFNAMYEASKAQSGNTLTLYKVTKSGDTYTIGEAVEGCKDVAVSTNTFNPSPVPGSGSLTIAEDGYYTFEISKPYTVITSVVNTYEAVAVSTYTIRGTVQDEDGNPVDGATVTVAEKTAVTDAAGAFSIAEVDEGDYTLTVSKDGFAVKSVPVSISADTDLGTIVLSLPVSTMTINVAHNSYPVEGATVVLYGSAAQEIDTKTTNSAGQVIFSIKGQVENPYSFKITAPGMKVYERTDVEFVQGGDTQKIANMESAPSVVNVTVTKNGEPYNGAYCYLYDEDYKTYPDSAQPKAQGMSDEEGKLTLSYIGTLYNPYTLKTTATGCEDVLKELTLVAGETIDVNVEITDIIYTFNAKVVTGADNTPVTGATVEIYSGSTLLYTAAEGENGNYSVAEITDLMVNGKTLTLKVSKDGYNTYTEEFTFDGNVDKTVELVEATYTFNVQVVNSADQAVITGAKVELYDGETQLFTAAEGADGNYSVTDPIKAIDVKDKTLTLKVDKADFKPYTEEITLTGNYDGKVELEAYGATIVTGKLTERSTGEPAVNVSVTLAPAEGEAMEAKADDEGVYTFVIEGEPEASYTFTTHSEYYKEISTSIRGLKRGETKTLDLRLQDRMLKYSGKVLNAVTEQNAQKVTFKFNGEELKANADGDYTTEIAAKAAAANTPIVEISSPYYEELEKQPVFFSGADVEATYNLTPIYYTFTAIVNGNAGNEDYPLTDAKVEVQDDKKVDMEVTDEGEGKYSFKAMAEDAAVRLYTVTVSAEDYDPIMPFFFKFEQADAEHTFLLKKIVSIDTLYMDVLNGETMIFDLQGRRINAAQVKDLNSGIYIVNGKKVVVRH